MFFSVFPVAYMVLVSRAGACFCCYFFANCCWYYDVGSTRVVCWGLCVAAAMLCVIDTLILATNF